MSKILILGAGFGGLSTATELAGSLDGTHEIILIDRADNFSMGLRKAWALFGMGTIADGTRSRRSLRQPAIRFMRGEIESVDPNARTASVDGQTLSGDYLVIALGAQARPDLVPGLSEHGHNAWDRNRISGLKDALERFAGGRIAVVIAGAPYPCPPAPYELAMLLGEWLEARGRRERTQLSVTTLQPLLLPAAGKMGSDWLAAQLSARRITFAAGRTVERVEPNAVVFRDGALEFDILIAVPPHRVPAVVKSSGLTGDGDWIDVNPQTLATRFENVFAIGDVTQIRLANGLMLPKAGLIAELEGRAVAAAIANELKGTQAPAAFDGRAYCFLETGISAVSLIDGNFYTRPEPQVAVREPSPASAQAKREFERERLARWFKPVA
jgi:sulfide:quinone oxidoreductase